jgi:chemotaxis protein CheX
MTTLAIRVADLSQGVEDILSSFVGEIPPGPGVAELETAGTWLEAWVSISGPWNGEVAVDVLGASAPVFAGAMLGMPASSLTMEDTADALCELANMVGGQVKAALPPGCRMSLPLMRMRRRADASAASGATSESSSRTFDWSGHPIRVSLRTLS